MKILNLNFITLLFNIILSENFEKNNITMVDTNYNNKKHIN